MFKTFVALDPLAASEVNGYLMKQTVIVCTSGTRPSSPVEGMTIFETDTDRTMQYDGTVWHTAHPIFASRKRSAGDMVVNSASFADLNPGWDGGAAQDISLPGAAGDVFRFTLSGRWHNQVAYGFLDVLVNGTNYISGGTTNGVAAWMKVTSVEDALGGSFMYRTVSGDYSGGVAACRLRYKTSPIACQLMASAGSGELTWLAENLGKCL